MAWPFPVVLSTTKLGASGVATDRTGNSFIRLHGTGAVREYDKKGNLIL
jgi:hypothetical protein